MRKRILPSFSPKELQIYLQIPEEVRFISHPDFQDSLIEEDLFGEDAEAIEIAGWRGFRPLSGGGSSENPLQGRVLSREEEKLLFLRFNYARYQLFLLKKVRSGAVSRRRARKMIIWFQRAEKTRLEIIEANLPLAVSRAKRFSPSRLALPERISECNLALIKCIERFDVSRCNKFSTYFFVNAYWRLVKSERDASKVNQVDPAVLETMSQDGPETNPSDSTWVIREIVDSRRGYGLSDIEREVLSRHYGFLGQEETLTSISKKVNLSIERVRQIKEEALRKIRRFLLANPQILNLKQSGLS